MGTRARAMVAALVVATGGLVGSAAPAGAVTGSFDATCVTMSGSIPVGPPTVRTFTYEAHAPDTVAPGATVDMPVDIDYAVPPSANDGIASFALNGDTLSTFGFAVPGGEPSIHGAARVTAPTTVGDPLAVDLVRFGAISVIGGSAISDLCTPMHRLVIARVGVGVPLVSIGDAAVVEGSAGTRALEFAVTLSRPAATPVTVAFDSEDGTATAPSDYAPRSGTLLITAGHVSGVLSVPVRGDGIEEAKENLRVRLHDPVGAGLGRAVGTGRIIDDDPESRVRLSVGDGSVVEGARGTRSARFTVSLSAPATQRVTFHFSTSDGAAVAGHDYRTASYDGFINEGSRSTTLPVPVIPNAAVDGDRTFAVHLSDVSGATVRRANGTGRILDDD